MKLGEELTWDPETEQAESHDAETHDRTACKGDLEPFAEAGAGPLGGAGVGLGRHAHPDVAGKSRAKSPHDERERHERRAVDRVFDSAESEQRRDAGHEDGEDFVFGAQKGHRPVSNEPADLLHFFRPWVLFRNQGGTPESVGEGENAEERDDYD